MEYIWEEIQHIELFIAVKENVYFGIEAVQNK